MNNRDKKIENFNNNEIVNSCHYMCSNLTTINIVLLVVLLILIYMYVN